MRRLCLLLLMILMESCLAKTSCGTKRKCKKLGATTGVVASCQPNTQLCEGKQMTGKKYCKDYKSCACCVPPISCSKGTLRPCEALNGTCISQSAECDGREVTDKTFCKATDTCKCCFPEPPCYCPNTTCEAMHQNQTYKGICRMENCLFMETKADKCKNSNCNCCINVTTACPEDEGFFRSNGSTQCFKYFHDVKYNWYNAKAKCLKEGLVLARPSNEVILALRKDLVLKYGSFCMAWVDARGDGSVFRWTHDNTVLSSNNSLWFPGHPGKWVTNDYCLKILAAEQKGFEYLSQYPNNPYWESKCNALGFRALCELV